MKFEKPLVEAVFLKRYKRFFADIKIGDETVVAHVPNTGSLKGCNTPMSLCRVSPAANPERKLKFTLEMVQTPTSWVGVNTSHPNLLVRELWESKRRAEWQAHDSCQLEVKISAETRLDMALWHSSHAHELKKGRLSSITPPLHFIEVKNVTYAEGDTALFPDAVTERGQKHLIDLMNLMKQGYSCELVFVVQRLDCKYFSPADDIDPVYGKLLRQAYVEGLIITPLTCGLSADEISLLPRPLAIRL